MIYLLRIFFCVLFCCSLVEARTLSWNEAVSLAQQNSPEYQAALKTFEAADETELTKYSGFLPRLSASASGTHSGAPGTASSTSYSASLTLSQNLFAGFSDIYTFSQKKNSLLMARATLDTARSSLSRALKQAYAGVYYIQDYKKLVTDILKRRKENYRNVKLQYDVGRENRGSLMLSESYVQLAEYDVNSTEHLEELAQEELRRITGLNEMIVVTENIPPEKLAPEKPDFAALALRHPDVIQAQGQELSSLYDLKITRAQFLPSLDFSGSYSYAGSTFFPDQDSWRMGLTLSIPLFDGLRTFSSYRSQSSTNEAKTFSALNTRLKTESDIKRAYYEYTEALQKEKIDEGFGQAAVLRAEVARNKYKNGFLSFEEWDNIESDLISKQKEKLSSEKTRITKQAAWDEAQNLGVF